MLHAIVIAVVVIAVAVIIAINTIIAIITIITVIIARSGAGKTSDADVRTAGDQAAPQHFGRARNRVARSQVRLRLRLRLR